MSYTQNLENMGVTAGRRFHFGNCHGHARVAVTGSFSPRWDSSPLSLSTHRLRCGVLAFGALRLVGLSKIIHYLIDNRGEYRLSVVRGSFNGKARLCLRFWRGTRLDCSGVCVVGMPGGTIVTRAEAGPSTR